MASFQHYDLKLIHPDFDSTLIDIIIELDALRRCSIIKNETSSTPETVFLQLKKIFHTLESLGSARIEGNHTTLSDYVENHLEGMDTKQEHLAEIANIETAMQFVEDHFKQSTEMSEYFIREIHALTVQNLHREGDKTPGNYRNHPVSISQSKHQPPDAFLVPEYMQKLVSFINTNDSPKYALIKIALVHHRFSWIHPFGNGNGRVVRLLTYAMLIKYGFRVEAGERLLNPTAVFCNDRNSYYAMLAEADTATQVGLENWCSYVLNGINIEISKLDNLMDYQYLTTNILKPTLTYALKRKFITEEEKKVLDAVCKLKTAKNADLTKETGIEKSKVSRLIRSLSESGMLQPTKPNGVIYTIGFSNNYLLRGIIDSLRKTGFISDSLAGDKFV